MGGKTVQAQYNEPLAKVFAAARLAVASLGYTVLVSDFSSGTISFNTGRSMKSFAGQDLSATLVEANGVTSVFVGGSLAKGGNPFGGGQLVAWGEKSALSQKFLGELSRSIEQVSIASVTHEMKTCPECAEEVKAAARKCRFCGFVFQI